MIGLYQKLKQKVLKIQPSDILDMDLDQMVEFLVLEILDYFIY
jgi:hypothetical protein